MLMFRVQLLAVAVLAAAAIPGRAVEPRGPSPARLLEPGFYTGLLDQGVARVKKLEAVEMLTAILRGTDMGPNSCWFHPGQSRYDWKWLAGRYDRDRDGKITPAEFAGSPELFERLDRDDDGKITAADLDWSERSPYFRQLMSASGALRMMGGDNGGKITHDDWERTFKRLSKGKGFITPEDLREMLFPRPTPPSGPPPAELSPLMLLKGLLDGDIGSPFEGPRVGQRAPEFRLPRQDGTGPLSLADLRGKPVVLVFGSFT
jgi:Ca2+-binding EF-hand superfamily protein